jgi:TPR repeat protein
MKRSAGRLFYPCLLALSLCACVPVPKIANPPSITGLDQTLKQAAAGDVSAQMALGDFFLRDRGGGLGKDEQTALRLYYMAADQGNAGAQGRLSYRFSNANSQEMPVPDALMESAYWSYQRARSGDRSHMQQLATLYARHDFPAYDLIESCKWRLLMRQTCNPKIYSDEIIDQASQRAQPLLQQFPVKP